MKVTKEKIMKELLDRYIQLETVESNISTQTNIIAEITVKAYIKELEEQLKKML